MAGIDAAFVLFVLFVAGIGPLLLYVFVRREHDDRDVLDRSDAERVVRRDVDDE
ncbi:hypothetical protein [Halocalculus aciditolerans]|uniref:Uncharacterized protein n=1 Tax=Halocalculus aciditolerans TaxID=1383812 RepID=A0A830FE87_9EURY|nr:hypothetical protein [Halocalculus aciditolerans]GGL66449.1 hypothetical protein GCM10009039_25510 [Halocalculus aciditolerans]